MKSRIYKISLIIISIVLVFFMSTRLYIQNIKADSGWDTSYDSGGFSSSSDWGGSYDFGGFDSDSSYSGGSSSAGLGFFSSVIISMFISVAYYEFLIIPLSKRKYMTDNKKQKRFATTLLTFRVVLITILDIILPIFVIIDFLSIFALISFNLNKTNNKNKDVMNYYKEITPEDANKVIPDFDINKFKEYAYKTFYDTQIAWMNFDYDKLKELLTDELYNNYLMSLEALKLKGHVNTMKNFELIKIKLFELKEENNSFIARVVLNVKFYDYVENPSNGIILRGNSSRKVDNTYVLMFVRSKNNSSLKNCPRCGAPVNGNATGVCEYCNSKLVNEEYDWVLSKKEIVNQK